MGIEESRGQNYMMTGLQAMKEYRWREAIACFRKVLSEDPSNMEIEGNLAFALSRSEEYDEAIEVLKRLCVNQPKQAKWPYMVGYQFYCKNSWSQAIDWFDKALSLSTRYVKVLYRKGYAHLRLSQWEEGTKSLQRCLDSWDLLTPDLQQVQREYYGKANFQLGKAYLAKGLRLKARRPLQLAVQMDGNNHDIRYELGKCLLENRDVEGAIRELERANALKPNTHYILDRLAQAYAANGERGRAEILLQSIPYPRHRAYVLKTLGSIYLDQEKTAQALEVLQIAAKKDSTNHNIQYLLGRAFEASGQERSAVLAYTRAIDLKLRNYQRDFPDAEERLREISNGTVNDSLWLEQLAAEGQSSEQEGVIDYYNSPRGFGFISSSRYSKVFFHINSVVEGYIPVVGERVRFEVEQSEKGPRAPKVRHIITDMDASVLPTESVPDPL